MASREERPARPIVPSVFNSYAARGIRPMELSVTIATVQQALISAGTISAKDVGYSLGGNQIDLAGSSSGFITDANNNIWQIVSGEIEVNGTVDTGAPANVTEVLSESGTIWAENSSGLWQEEPQPGGTWQSGQDSWAPAGGTSAAPAIRVTSIAGNFNRGAVTGFAIQAVPGDTTGTLVQLAEVTNAGIQQWFTAAIVGYDANKVLLWTPTQEYIIATNGESNLASSLPVTDLGTTGAAYTPPATVCFAEGTRIRTAQGETAVENLAAGDQVAVLDNGAQTTRRVAWIGYRDINLATHPDPFIVQPVRIRRDAFASDVPCRDLLVSPDHAVLIQDAAGGGILIPARLLVNGATIVRETRMMKVRYFHVELDRHSVIFSENLPSESYLDTGNRSFFQNGGGVIDLNAGFIGDAPQIGRETHSCAPFIHDAETVLPVWSRLARRAEEMGHAIPTPETTRDPAPVLFVDGREVRPIQVSGQRFSYILPPGAAEVRLRSRAARPCEARPWLEDHRHLGVLVIGVQVRDGQDVENVEDIALDGPAFGRGWWDVEHDGQQMARWTDGDAVLWLPEANGSHRVVTISTKGEMIYPLDAADAIARVA
jgi:hypothetical protein